MTQQYVTKGSKRYKAITKQCLNCNSDFLCPTNDSKKFCCPACSVAYKQKDNILKDCDYCHKPLYVTPKRLRNSKSGFLFCCRQCKDLAQRLNGLLHFKPKHYNTKRHQLFASISKEQLTIIVRESTTVYGVLERLELAKNAYNHTLCKKKIVEFDLDTSHFLGQAHNRNKNIIPIEEYLQLNGRYINSCVLRKKLVNLGILLNKCYRCNNTHWEDQEIPLELHHINGNTKDNRLENLKSLCPNCHALTDNYRNKKR